ncbi:MAG: hypothetical protein K5859_00865 [Atopobiaceae bacterium]|nr:hypothetical protein [Atopobiaceae bacterium]
MSIEVDAYEWDGGPFRGRQHIISHIDMLFGLGTRDWSAGRERRIAVNVQSRYGDMRASQMWHYDEEALEKGRAWIQYQSLYAASWEQLYPKHGGNYFTPDDVRDDEDLLDLLNECMEIWVEEDDFCGGDRERFQEETSFVVLLGSWEPVRADRIIVRGKPPADFKSLPVPVNVRKVVGAKHGNCAEWRAFAEKICKDEHVKRELFERQGGNCPVCGLELGDSFVIHHIDYDHECGLVCQEEFAQSDCGLCHAEHPSLFEECASRLRAVHGDCNYLIDSTL